MQFVVTKSNFKINKVIISNIVEVATVRNFKPSSEFSIEFLCLDNDGRIFEILGSMWF